MVPDSLIRNLSSRRPQALHVGATQSRVEAVGRRPGTGASLRRSGCTRQTVKNAAHRLADLGIIVIEQSGHKPAGAPGRPQRRPQSVQSRLPISTDSTPERRSGTAPKAAPNPGA